MGAETKLFLVVVVGVVAGILVFDLLGNLVSGVTGKTGV